MSKTKHPMQPIVWAGGVIRFKENKIVSALYEAASEGRKLDLNMVAAMGFSRDDHEQFAQLIGYSVSGFGDLSYARRDTVKEADAIAARMSLARKTKVAKRKG
jgi:hypothetical protein